MKRISAPPSPSRPDVNADLGFGSVVARQSRRRFLNRDGSFNVRREGLGFWQSIHIYDFLMTVTWPRLLFIMTSLFVVVNGAFATLYYLLGPDALSGIGSHEAKTRFAECFFFSVTTLSTIGYGNIAPHGLAAEFVVVIEAMVGFIGVALAAGIVFARFSRPQAKIIFSRQAVIAPYQDGRAFMFRIANQKSSQLVNLECKVLFARRNREDPNRREFSQLSLERESVVFFPLTWTVVHPIDDASPLDSYLKGDLSQCDAEFLVVLTGFDETSSQVVHARSSYKGDEVLWAARFVSMFNPIDEDGTLSVDMSKLHSIEPVDLA